MKQHRLHSALASTVLSAKNRAKARLSVFEISKLLQTRPSKPVFNHQAFRSAGLRAALLVLITFVSLICLNCQKQTRAFKDIEVRGRLLNFYTKAPLSNVEVRLRANNVHSASSYAEAAILLDSYRTGQDGTFVLKSKASKKNNYQIQLEGDYHIYSYASVDTMFESKPNSIVYLDDMYSGEHTYWYKIRFTPASGSCAWIYDQGQQLSRIRSGVDTTILRSASISYYTLRANKNTYWYSYKTGSCTDAVSATPMSMAMQISAADTLFFQITY